MCDSIEGARPVNTSKVDSERTNSTTIGEKQPPYNVTQNDVQAANISADGVGLEKALANFAKWYKYEEFPGGKYHTKGPEPRSETNTETACQEYGYDDWNDTLSVKCYESHNATNSAVVDYRVDNAVNRQWFWMLCNEPFAYWQV